jgi:hypothetical protein
MMMKSKRVKQKTKEQLHDEIMHLFIGQEIEITLITLIETLVGVAEYVNLSNSDLLRLILDEQKIYEEMRSKND